MIHAGLPDYEDFSLEEINTVYRLRAVPRCRHDASREERVFQALLWSDPKELGGRSSEPSTRGAGVHFGQSLTERFLDASGLEHLVLSHRVVVEGYRHHHGGHVTTVFSAAAYGKRDDNKAAILEVTRPRAKDPVHLRPRQWSALERGSEQALRHATVRDLRTLRGAAPGPEDARREVLRLLRAMIFANKQELHMRFCARDTAGSGEVTRQEWAYVMAEQFGAGIAWLFLLPYLAGGAGAGSSAGLASLRRGGPRQHGTACVRGNRVAYAGFIERFQNPLTRHFMQEWHAEIRPYVRLRVARCCTALGKVTADSRLSYHEVKDMLHRGRGGLPQMDPRLLHFLVASLDINGDGFIQPGEFQQAFGRPRPEHGDKGLVLLLWEQWRLGEDGGWAELKEAFRAEEEGCGGGLPREDFARLCARHFRGSPLAAVAEQDGALDAGTWKSSTAALDPKKHGTVRWKTLQREVRRLSERDARAVALLEVITTISRARVQLHQLFLLWDRNGDGWCRRTSYGAGWRGC